MHGRGGGNPLPRPFKTLYSVGPSCLLVGQAGAALRAAAGEDLPAIPVGHALAEAMDLGTLELLGLIGTLHVLNTSCMVPGNGQGPSTTTAGDRPRSSNGHTSPFSGRSAYYIPCFPPLSTIFSVVFLYMSRSFPSTQHVVAGVLFPGIWAVEKWRWMWKTYCHPPLFLL